MKMPYDLEVTAVVPNPTRTPPSSVSEFRAPGNSDLGEFVGEELDFLSSLKYTSFREYNGKCWTPRRHFATQWSYFDGRFPSPGEFRVVRGSVSDGQVV